MSSLSQTMENTVKGFLQDYVEAGRTKNMNVLSSHCTDDCVRTGGPKALMGAAGFPENHTMNNEEYAAEFNGMTMYEFEDHVIYRQVIDAQNMKAAVLSEAFVKFYTGEKTTRTFVWFMDLNEDGTKLKSVHAHVDIEEARNWFADIKARKEAQKQ